VGLQTHDPDHDFVASSSGLFIRGPLRLRISRALFNLQSWN